MHLLAKVQTAQIDLQATVQAAESALAMKAQAANDECAGT